MTGDSSRLVTIDGVARYVQCFASRSRAWPHDLLPSHVIGNYVNNIAQW